MHPLRVIGFVLLFLASLNFIGLVISISYIGGGATAVAGFGVGWGLGSAIFLLLLAGEKLE